MHKTNEKSDKDIKIALLLSGHTRSIEYTKESLLKIKKETNADVFIHTWSEREMSQSTWRQPDDYKELNAETSNLIIKSINPVSVLVEKEDFVKEKICNLLGINDADVNSNNLPGHYYMIYGMSKVFDLFENYCQENNKNYDVVVRYRFDLDFKDILNFKSDLKAANFSNAILMPDHNLFSSLGAMFDGVIIAKPKIYSTSLASINKYYHCLCLEMKKDGKVIPEAIITNLIRLTGVKIKRCKTSFFIIRNHGIVGSAFSKHAFPRYEVAKSRRFLISSSDYNSEKGTLIDRYITENSDFFDNSLYLASLILKKIKQLITR